MKGGRVVRLRLSPSDCMGVTDVLDKLGLTAERFSFDQAARIALSSLLQSARSHGAIPEREGFEYLKMMSRFTERISQDRVKKLAVSELVGTLQPAPLLDDATRARRQRRYEELRFRKEADPLNFPPDLQPELSALVEEFFKV